MGEGGPSTVHMKRFGVLVRKFGVTPKGNQSGHGLSFI